MALQRITALFTRKLAGEASPEELLELEKLLRTNQQEQYFEEILSNWWDSGKPETGSAGRVQEERFHTILQKAGKLPSVAEEMEQMTAPVIALKKGRFRRRVFVAAAIAGLVFFTAWKFFLPAKPGAKLVQENEIVAKKGAKSELLLPDGSRVWLNSDSKLTYNNSFNDSLREVALEGEAYFDVVKNPQKPFIVHTSGINIKVLGTAFNVKSYPQEPTIEATLVRGLIVVEKNNQPQSSKILLKPNEKLVFNKVQENDGGKKVRGDRGKTVAILPDLPRPQSISIISLPKNISDSIRQETSWVYGKLLFEGESFRELAPKMERWFNVKISFRNDRVAAYRFRGVFENESIAEALHALQMTAPFTYSKNGNEIMIDKK